MVSASELRAAFWTDNHTAHNHTAHHVWDEIKSSLDNTNTACYKCELITSNGECCNKVFNSYNALIVHQIRTAGGDHGEVSPFFCGILTNRCPNCLTTFSSLEGARNHLKRAFLSKSCNRDKSFMNYPIHTSAIYSCPFCCFETPDLTAYVLHRISWAVPPASIQIYLNKFQ